MKKVEIYYEIKKKLPTAGNVTVYEWKLLINK